VEPQPKKKFSRKERKSRKKDVGATGWSPLDLKGWHVQFARAAKIFRHSSHEEHEG
jgi:hypothetical protein